MPQSRKQMSLDGESPDQGLSSDVKQQAPTLVMLYHSTQQVSALIMPQCGGELWCYGIY